MNKLKASKPFRVRFSEVDSMKVVWHGSYPLYLEDAREHFGKEFGLGYNDYISHHLYAPLVEMNIKYKRPLVYGMNARVDIIYHPTEAAKVVFDYEIYNEDDGTLMATAHTVQVFMDLNYQLVLQNPDFYEEWKKRRSVL